MERLLSAHTALISKAWFRTNFTIFWNKEIWPPNSPDLSPIENMWAILKEKVNKMDPPPSSIEQITDRGCEQSLVKYLS